MPWSAFDDLRQSIQYRPLNARALLDAGVIRVTDPSGNPDGEGFSLVTQLNDMAPNSATPQWANRPQMYETAMQALNQPGPLYDGKYRQVLWSAMQRGMSPADVFLQTTGGLLGR